MKILEEPDHIESVECNSTKKFYDDSDNVSVEYNNSNSSPIKPDVYGINSYSNTQFDNVSSNSRIDSLEFRQYNNNNNDQSQYGYSSDNYTSNCRKQECTGLSRSQVQRNTVNPASTIQFLLHMSYPPPPIAFESLRKRIEQLTDGTLSTLTTEDVLPIVAEINTYSTKAVYVVLFVIQQRLHSSKIQRVSLALQLLKILTNTCGIVILREVNKDLMKSIGSVIRTASFKERTITGQLGKLGRKISGHNSVLGISMDAEVHELRRLAKEIIKHWVDEYSAAHEAFIRPIINYYNHLLSKKIQFDELALKPMPRAQGVYESYGNNQRSATVISNNSSTDVFLAKYKMDQSYNSTNAHFDKHCFTDSEMQQLTKIKEVLSSPLSTNHEIDRSRLMLNSLLNSIKKVDAAIKENLKTTSISSPDDYRIRQMQLIADLLKLASDDQPAPSALNISAGANISPDQTNTNPDNTSTKKVSLIDDLL